MVANPDFFGTTAKLVTNVQNYSRLAALIVLLWDYCDTLFDEVRLFWKLPLDQPKLTYIISRYFGMAFQLANFVVTLLTGIGITGHSVPHHICKRWHIMQIVGFFTLYAVGNASLVTRTCILYKESRIIILLLPVMVIAEYVVAIIVTNEIMKTITFDNECNGLTLHWAPLVYISMLTFNQAAIWFLIWKKRKPSGIIPKGPVVLNGGQWTWFLAAALLAILIPFSNKTQISRPYIIFSWPITLISIGTCRQILNSKKYRHWILHGTRSQGSENSSSSSDILLEQITQRTWTIHSGSHATTADDDGPMIRSFNSNSNVLGSSFTTNSQSSSLVFDDHRSTNDNIEIGSVHISSSLDSEELREHWNNIYNPSPLHHL